MKKRNLFKLAALTAVFALGSMFANAQITDPTDTRLNKQTDPTKVVKVIDNKGTVKYIQTTNGITTMTSTNTGNQTVTTFQLGGTLTESTYINTAGEIFAINGLYWHTGDGAADSTATTGYSFLVRDLATGATRQLALNDIINAGTHIDVIGSDVLTDSYEIHLPTSVTLDSYKTVYVFRNGAKLLAGVDYSVTSSGSPLIYTVTLHNGAASTTPQYSVADSYETFELYAGDRIEIQFIK